MPVVFALLFGAERDKEIAVRAFGQFSFDVSFAAAQQIGFDALVQLIKVAIAGGPSPVVQFVILAVKAKKRAEQRRIEKIHQRIQFIEPIFDWGAGEDEGI